MEIRRWGAVILGLVSAVGCGSGSSVSSDAPNEDAADIVSPESLEDSGPIEPVGGEKDGSSADGVPCETDSDCADLAPEPCKMSFCGDSGACEVENSPNGLPCDDLDACTTDTVCFVGECGGIADVEGAEPGELGYPCLDNGDCDSGFCVAITADTAICTELCLETCPKGFGCKSVLNAGQDVLFVCTPVGGLGFAVDCDDQNPCTSDACDSEIGCTYSPNSLPCDDGNACTENDQCISSECVGVGTPDCGCEADIDCADFEDGDLCNGTLFCGDGECTVDPDTVVVCPGAVQCRESVCAPLTGECVVKPVLDGTPCSDGNPCSQPDACVLGACKPGDDICGECEVDADCDVFDDGDACTGTLACIEGICATAPGSIPSCTTDEPCRVATCEPSSGACSIDIAVDGTPCEDGEPCTISDLCVEGSCESGNDACEGCLGEPNGTPCDDADPCTLGDACVDGLCTPSEVSSCDDGVECTDDECLGDGSCAYPVSVDGTPCDDGLFCTSNDACLGGACTAGVGAACNDGDPCTVDSCDEEAGCQFAPTDEALPCDDGDPCTGGTVCAGGICSGGALVSCNDGDPCTVEGCSPGIGCESAASSGAPCDDGNACTTEDSCVSGICFPGPATVCDDGNPCTDDSCDPVAGCLNLPNDAACSDGVACTVNDTCSGGDCAPGPNLCACESDADCTEFETPCTGALQCIELGELSVCAAVDGSGVECAEDGNPCTVETCDVDTGTCVSQPVGDGAACDDGNACSTGESCSAGDCLPAGALACDDANPCTSDSCTASEGCVYGLVEGSCDDGNACTSGDTCVAGDCAATGTVNCNDSNPCTLDSCAPATGCLAEPDDAATCSDGDACTAGDACTDGACVPGEFVCACSTDADCVVLDDGNPCNGVLYCNTELESAQCEPIPGSVVECGEGGTCLNPTCNAMTGECEDIQAADGLACDDGDTCTLEDTCLGGACVGTSAQTCDDGNPCTDDSCDPATGCQFAPNTAPCTDFNACTEGDICAGGACVPGENTCGCDTDADCAGLEDGNFCNGTLFCDTSEGVGVCAIAPNSVVVCPAVLGSGGCVVSQCQPTTGACVEVTAQDGTPCNDGDVCSGNDFCTGGACEGTPGVGCDDGNICTNDVCQAGVGCAHKPIGIPCDDGDFCTVGDKCSSGVCTPGSKTCSCKKDSHCKKYDDANVCNGSLFCEPIVVSASGKITEGVCSIVEGTPVNCAGGGVCEASSCDPLTGVCSLNPIDEGASCTEGDVCALGSICLAAECAETATLDCDDANPCTTDSCDAALGCVHEATDGPCEDGLLCTTGDGCEFGVCVATANACGCDSDADCAEWEDGDLCNGALVCGETGLCQVDPGTVISCSGLGEPAPCSAWACNPATGSCEMAPTTDAPCDDADACTYGDGCIDGECAPLGETDCDDGNPCTIDSCNSVVGCVHEVTSGPCDDGNPCTLGDKCQGGECIFKNVKNNCP